LVLVLVLHQAGDTVAVLAGMLLLYCTACSMVFPASARLVVTIMQQNNFGMLGMTFPAGNIQLLCPALLQATPAAER
jgi:hypothetical protein